MMMMMIHIHILAVHILVGRRKAAGLEVQQEKVLLHTVDRWRLVWIGRRLWEVSASSAEETDEEERTGLGIGPGSLG